ncbi:MAG: phosphoribosyltransferase [Planctomycetes bacterium]|nr:phosphoribosyltransferase [Planctomycetota bacterium]
MFRDRTDAAEQLAERLRGRPWHEPVVLGIPRGGVVTAAVLADKLDAELDIVLARKLRAPHQPELALGAISETGEVYLNSYGREFEQELRDHIAEEIRHQKGEIERRRLRCRSVRPPAKVGGRSVIVTDDGIATGSTMIAALQAVRLHKPQELVVAVPVASPDRLAEVRRWCDETICLLTPDDFWAIGQFYIDFRTVEDDEVLELLRQSEQRRLAQPASADRP